MKGDNMKKVVFSKYNRTRRKEYRICTCIYDTEEGRFVEKRALCQEAQAHIDALAEHSAKMEGVFENIQILQPRMEQGAAVYDYLEGQTVEAQLTAQMDDIRNLPGLLKEKNAFLFAGPNETVRPANIDMLYDNLICADGVYYCMDCEWVVDEPLPVEFLQYRSVYYFYTKYRKQLEHTWTEEEFLVAAGIPAEKFTEYRELELKFQKKVRGDQFEFDDRKGTEKKVIPGEEVQKIQWYQQRIVQLQDEQEEKNADIEKLNAELHKHSSEMYRLSGDIQHLNELAHVKDAEIADRIQYAKDLEDIIQKMRRNPGYRITRIPARAFHAVFPRNSRRRKVLGYVKQGILHPQNVWTNAEARNRTYGDVFLGEGYKVHGKVHLPATDAPLVSIVIPVYNQVGYTYNCLVSIEKNTGDIPYEVILADDVSTDATVKIHHFADNVIVSRNSTNMGFLKNCNQAAEKARGTYILFLNNDTTVGENWLKPLVELMDRRADAGMVGSKLVYPDGKLQEAGGIIWQDGSGWNYGREQNADLPEYNYVKEADYISGAAIMIRTSLWKEIGGFDERFAPAYCEDSDLAFQVRERGYKVLYQPLSVVTHFEGVSNGTDLDSGLKKYQVENTVKFREKWAKVFQEQQAEGPDQLFVARDRSQHKKVVLFIDHYVPQYDKDAGSRTTFAYMKAFLKWGYTVKFLGDNFCQDEPYTTVLQQLGVEVLYGSWYATHWKEWIAQNGKYIDIVFMERPHITIKYIDYFRQHSDAKIIYYGHDLHYLREMREYELTGDEEIRKEAQKIRKVEYDCMRKADIAYYPSYLEIEEIKKNDPDISARAIPAYVFENGSAGECRNIQERKNLLFVGGFAHGPNVDAVKWFVQDIFPFILEKHPDMVFYIAGSHPPEEIKQLHSEHICVKGFVSDEELAELYRNCRIAVVPLRYGAGVKGKIVEAIYHGIPVLTTPIGAEGLEGYDEVMAVYENAEQFAEGVIDLYENAEALEKMISHMPEFIERYFSPDAALKIIRQDIT